MYHSLPAHVLSTLEHPGSHRQPQVGVPAEEKIKQVII